MALKVMNQIVRSDLGHDSWQNTAPHWEAIFSDGSLPSTQYFINALGNRAPGVRSFPTSAEQVIIVGFTMPNVSDY